MIIDYYRNFHNRYRKWIKLVLWLFVFSGIVGGVAANFYPEIMDQILAGFEAEFGDSPALDMNLAIDIFLRNLTVSVIAWLGGILLGLIPVLVVAANGFILGYVIVFIGKGSENLLSSVVFLVAGLVPHGIIEIPAFLIATILGLSLGLDWLSEWAVGTRGLVLWQSFARSFKYFVVVIIALMAAAVIEVFVSGKLVSNL
jgi:stage II sporulation protein M